MQLSDVQVRRAHPDEWATIRDVRLAALADAPDAFASTLAREQDRAEAEWRSRIALIPWFLAWHEGQPAGLVATFPVTQPGPAGPAHPVGEWHLVSMWVPPAVRGRGVAGLLVTAVLEHARVAGAERVTLWAATGNPRRGRVLPPDGLPADRAAPGLPRGRTPPAWTRRSSPAA